MPCGGPKKSPRTSSIVQIIFFSFGPLRSVKIYRVFKTLKFSNILISNVLVIWPLENEAQNTGFRCRFKKGY